jgi:hypothetical protein
MTAGDMVIVDLATSEAELREHVAVYRILVSVLLTEIFEWQRDPKAQERRYRQIRGALRDEFAAALCADLVLA